MGYVYSVSGILKMLSSILPASSLRSNSVNSVAPHVGEKLGDKLFRIRSDFEKEFPTRIKKSFLSIFFGKCFFFRRKIEKLESITDWRRSSRRPNFSKTFFCVSFSVLISVF